MGNIKTNHELRAHAAIFSQEFRTIPKHIPSLGELSLSELLPGWSGWAGGPWAGPGCPGSWERRYKDLPNMGPTFYRCPKPFPSSCA